MRVDMLLVCVVMYIVVVRGHIVVVCGNIVVVWSYCCCVCGHKLLMLCLDIFVARS